MSYRRICDCCGKDITYVLSLFHYTLKGNPLHGEKDICADCYAEMREYINRKNSKLYGKQAEQIIVDEAVSEVKE